MSTTSEEDWSIISSSDLEEDSGHSAREASVPPISETDEGSVDGKECGELTVLIDRSDGPTTLKGNPAQSSFLFTKSQSETEASVSTPGALHRKKCFAGRTGLVLCEADNRVRKWSAALFDRCFAQELARLHRKQDNQSGCTNYLRRAQRIGLDALNARKLYLLHYATAFLVVATAASIYLFGLPAQISPFTASKPDPNFLQSLSTQLRDLVAHGRQWLNDVLYVNIEPEHHLFSFLHRSSSPVRQLRLAAHFHPCRDYAAKRLDELAETRWFLTLKSSPARWVNVVCKATESLLEDTLSASKDFLDESRMRMISSLAATRQQMSKVYEQDILRNMASGLGGLMPKFKSILVHAWEKVDLSVRHIRASYLELGLRKHAQTIAGQLSEAVHSVAGLFSISSHGAVLTKLHDNLSLASLRLRVFYWSALNQIVNSTKKAQLEPLMQQAKQTGLAFRELARRSFGEMRSRVQLAAIELSSKCADSFSRSSTVQGISVAPELRAAIMDQ